MRRFRSFNRILTLVMIPVFSLTLLGGCVTTQSGGGLNVASVIGAAAEGVLPGHGGSLARAAVAVGKSFEDITPEQEYYIGRAVAANILATYRPASDERVDRYLNLLGQTLAQASDKPETYGGYHFMMLDSTEVNAFAAPGGFILVTRGMIRLCNSEDALAAVLAHEIAHVQGQHGLRSIKKGRLTSAFTILATEAAKSYSPAQLSQLVEAFEGSINDVTSSLMNNGYSRELEREADKQAAKILVRVGYDPSAIVVMLSEMQKQVKPGGPGFGKTHPDPKDRIAELTPVVRVASAKVSPAERRKRFDTVLSGL